MYGPLGVKTHGSLTHDSLHVHMVISNRENKHDLLYLAPRDALWVQTAMGGSMPTHPGLGTDTAEGSLTLLLFFLFLCFLLFVTFVVHRGLRLNHSKESEVDQESSSRLV